MELVNKFLIICSLLLIVTNTQCIIDLKLHKKPNNISVYDWCMARAKKNVDTKFLQVLRLFRIDNKKNQALIAKHKIIFKKDFNPDKEKIEKKIKNYDTIEPYVKNNIKKLFNDPYIKKIFSPTHIKIEKKAIRIMTKKAGAIVIVNNKKSPNCAYADYTGTIVLNLEKLKLSHGSLSNAIYHELAHLLLNHHFLLNHVIFIRQEHNAIYQVNA